MKDAPGIDEVMTALLLMQEERRSGLWSSAGRGCGEGGEQGEARGCLKTRREEAVGGYEVSSSSLIAAPSRSRDEAGMRNERMEKREEV